MMNLCALALVVVGLLTACAPGWAEVPGFRFDGTKWIWYSADATESSPRAPAGICYFRSGVDVSEKTQITAAEVFITADNLFTLYLNDKLVGQSETNPNAWNRPKRFDVTGLLFPGRNVVAVEAVNTVPGPAGLLVKLVGQLDDGEQIVLTTDAAWKGNDKEEQHWQLASFDDRSWRAAQVVGEYGCGPGADFARDLASIPPEQPGQGGRPLANWREVVAKQGPK